MEFRYGDLERRGPSRDKRRPSSKKNGPFVCCPSTRTLTVNKLTPNVAETETAGVGLALVIPVSPVVEV